MRLGLGTLRLPPEVFWAMTPTEFIAALEGAGIIGIGSGMTRSTLDALMATYPDPDGSETSDKE